MDRFSQDWFAGIPQAPPTAPLQKVVLVSRGRTCRFLKQSASIPRGRRAHPVDRAKHADTHTTPSEPPTPRSAQTHRPPSCQPDAAPAST
eukprot:3340843-Prymnesium_polylepis.2